MQAKYQDLLLVRRCCYLCQEYLPATIHVDKGICAIDIKKTRGWGICLNFKLNTRLEAEGWSIAAEKKAAFGRKCIKVRQKE